MYEQKNIYYRFQSQRFNMSILRVNSVDSLDRTSVKFQRSDTSLASSFRSIYEQYAIHINIVKWTGVLVMLALTTTTLVIIKERSTDYIYRNESDCKQILLQEEIELNINETYCNYMKQFNLPDNYYVNVCLHNRQIQVDLGHLTDRKARKKGLYFNLRQWNYLRMLMPHLSNAISEAKQRM